VLATVEEHQASILGISATMLLSVPAVAELLQDLRNAFGSRVQTIVGGTAFRNAPILYREIGADACAQDLRSAVSVVSSLLHS
jgi:methanogenic corrinoid protein MtbC1